MRLGFPVGLAFVLALSAAPALGQGWEGDEGDDGAWFGASARPAGETYGARSLWVYCGGRSPMGRPLTGDHNHAIQTAPGAFLMQVSIDATGGDTMDNEPRGDIRFVVDGSRVAMPPLTPNALDETFDVELPWSHPLIAALKSGRELVIASDVAPPRKVGLAGSSKTLTAAEAFCKRVDGLSRPASAPGAPAPVDGDPDAARARLATALAKELEAECRSLGGTGVVFEPEALTFHPGGAVQANFHRIKCTNAPNAMNVLGVGNCGASACAQRVYEPGPNGYEMTREYYQ